MTKFIYDTKAIMMEAWEIARDWVESGRRQSVKSGISDAMKRAWRHAKHEMTKAIDQAASNASNLRRGDRYLELLEVAERDNLSHGKPWVQNEMAIRFGGQIVCYVYAN